MSGSSAQASGSRTRKGCLTPEPVLWGSSLVGFGRYHYRYESGREGDSFRVGFSPRKARQVLYIMPGFDAYEGLLARLGSSAWAGRPAAASVDLPEHGGALRRHLSLQLLDLREAPKDHVGKHLADRVAAGHSVRVLGVEDGVVGRADFERQ